MAQTFQREKDGLRLDFRGCSVVSPPDRMPPGKYPYAQNVRRYLKEAVEGRAIETDPLFTLPDAVYSLRRMNDSTPAGPVSGFVIVAAAGGKLYANASQVATGLSGKRVSLVPFRPNQSVQPWMYVADDNIMLKVRPDGTTYLDGIEEPQDAPGVTFNGNQIPSSEPVHTVLNGWGPNAHVGAYEAGVNQSVTFGFNGATTQAYSNPGNAFDGDVTTKASSVLQHTHDYAGCVWGFTNPSAPIIPTQLTLNILSAIPLNGAGGVIVNKRSAGVWYSVDAGVSWTQIYLSGSRAKQQDSVVLPPNTDPAMVQVMAFNDSHDDMVHYVFEVQLGVQSVNTLYRYVYRSSATGATSNPSPVSDSGFNLAIQSANLSATSSTDPQVDKIDWYRFGGGLENYTYVGTSENSNPVFTDTLPDLTVENNPILFFDNFQPFPSIDLPRKGFVNVSGGVISWVSGDQFNVRWLPGNIIVIDGVPYTTDKRPTSTTTMTAINVNDGTGLSYEINQPALAAQPMRSMWGPTDNVAFMFACGDSLRPGTLYFTKGNNPDSAPDTNQIEVTSPSEPLQGGVIVNGLSMVGSTERFWLCYPNFYNALATVTGTLGSPFTLVLSISNRGLYAKKGICSDGGALAFFVGKDGIYISPGGNGSKSISDEDLFNLFPHEGFVQQNVIVGSTGYTFYAPDFSNPDAMELSFANGYLYFDYQDMGGNLRTMVYDVFAEGWVIDVYQFPVLTHSLEEGVVEGTLVGCSDGSIRNLSNTGIEVGTSVLLLPCFNAGDTRAEKQFGDIYLEANIGPGEQVAITPYVNLYNSVGAPSGFLNSVAAMRAAYIFDFPGVGGLLARDLGTSFTWPIETDIQLFVWQPSLIMQPEGIQDQPTDWDDGGTQEPKFVQGFRLQADTFNTPKSFQAQASDNLAFYTPNEVPVTFNGQSWKPFSFTPPFITHSMRLVSTDEVKWRKWNVLWDFQPYPEAVVNWQCEMLSFGNVGWFHLRQLNIPVIAPSDLLLTMVFDYFPTVSVIVPSTFGMYVKRKVDVPYNKSKLVSLRLSSAVPFRLFQEAVEVKLGMWGRQDAYQILKPFGGRSTQGALV